MAAWRERDAGVYQGATYGEMTIRKALQDKPIADRSEHEGYLNFTYNFRFNVVTNHTELQADGQWTRMDDYEFNSILRDMRNRGAKISQRRLHSLLESDFVDKYHPFHEYFEGLPEWDGTD